MVLILHRLTSSAKVETKILSFHGLSPYIDLPGMSTIVPALSKSPALLVPRRGVSPGRVMGYSYHPVSQDSACAGVMGMCVLGCMCVCACAHMCGPSDPES